MDRSSVYLSIGSNNGDRRALIGRAVAALSMLPGVTCARTSDYYKSEAWGFESENEFLNIAMVLHYERDSEWSVDEAEGLLDLIQGIEQSISPVPHRNADGSYRDREIDIDIIAIDDQAISTPRLTVPHPLASQRPFVTVPLSQLKQNVRGLTS